MAGSMAHGIIFHLFCLFLIFRTTHQTTYPCDSNAPCGCSQFPVMTNARIVDGEDAGFNTWSWAVSLKIRKNTASYRCGGTIIDESYVMTAAHCLDLGLNPSDITVYAGALHVYDGVIRTASQIYIHPSYDKTQSRNDIALIKLDQPLDLSNVNLAKICLPTIATTSEEYPAPSTSVVTVGWGTLWSDGPVSQILQQVTIQAVAAQSTYCQHIIKDPTVQFCAGTMPAGGKDTCQGDSGGPLMMFNPNKKWELVGVVSYGKGCGLPNYPGVYTRVSSYIEWINKTIPYRPPTTTYKPRTTEPTTTHKPRTTESATTRPPWPTTRTKETSTFPPRPTTTTGKMTTDGVGNSSGSININAYFLFSILIFVFNY